MQKSILYLDKKQGQTYQAIFKNNHGRRLYIQLQINNNEIFISLIIMKFSFQIVFTPTDLQGTDIMPFPANFILHTVLVTI